MIATVRLWMDSGIAYDIEFQTEKTEDDEILAEAWANLFPEDVRRGKGGANWMTIVTNSFMGDKKFVVIDAFKISSMEVI